MTDLERAKALLLEGGLTCAVCRGEEVFTSRFRGVKPLASWYAQGMDLAGFSAADKVVGRATAFLYVLLGVKSLYAGVISQAALEVLAENGIQAQYGKLVDHISNRAGDGICPFEQAVLEISQPQAAYRAIREKMAAMHIDI